MIEKIRKTAEQELSEIKYIPGGFILGFISKVLDDSNVPRINPIKQEYLDVIFETIYGGVEPEFETKKEYKAFQLIEKIFDSNNIHYVIDPKTGSYKDKSIPTLTLKK